MKSKIRFTLLSKGHTKIAGKTEEFYTYRSECGKYGVQFCAHPTRAWVFVLFKTANFTAAGKQHLLTNFDEFVGAWVERGIQQHELGGWDAAIAEVTAELYV